MNKSIANAKKPFDGYYTVIAKACGCSRFYVKKVLTNDLGEYADRDTELVRNIRQKAADIRKVLGSEGDFPC